MRANPRSRPYFRFAIASLCVVATMTGLFTYLLWHVLPGWQLSAAARQADRAIARPILETLARGNATVAAEDLATNLVETEDGGGLTFVRVRTVDGQQLLAAGEEPSRAVAAPSTRVDTARLHGANGELFVTVVRDGGYVVEVGQAAAPLDASVFNNQLQAVALMALLAVALWVALQVAYTVSIRTLVNSFFRLKYLHDTGEQLRASLDLHDVLAKLASDATALVRGRYGLVALMEHDSGELMLKVSHDHATGSMTLHQRPLDEWFIRRCVATNETVSGPAAATAYKQVLGQDAEIDADAPLVCVPMALRERVVGAIGVIRAPQHGAFAPAETRLLEELAGQAVTAIEQAQLFAKVRSDANELESSYDTTLKVLMAALDAKDNDTEGHCERVARLTVHLARSMGISEANLIDIERGALLHDVGKIGVPDAVLKQPKQLNQLEWEAMRKHPLLAGVMVSKVGFLEKALPILLYHHERYDGGGYPFGLSREHIPIEARIFSVIDAYDAMTSDRPYRKAMTHEEAMAEVRANCGTQFDPNVVEAFERLMESRPDLREKSTHTIEDGHDEDLDPTRSAA